MPEIASRDASPRLAPAWLLLLMLAVALLGAVFFLAVGLPAWAWRRECGALGVVHALGYFGPGLAAIVTIDRRIWTGRFRSGPAVRTVLFAVLATWALGIILFATQWGC